MNARSFTAAICKTIIDRVQSRPEIWQFRHPLYKRRIVQKQFWEELAVELGVNEQVLKKRWKHLKDQYRKELRKALDKDDEDTVSWRYFKLFSFYREEVLYRDRERAVAAAIDADLPDNSDEDNENEKPKVESSPSRVLEKVKAIRKKRDDSVKLNVILKRLTQTKNLLKTKIKDLDSRNNDPDYMFLLSLMPSLKQLTEVQKLQLKGKINNWLLEALNVQDTSTPHSLSAPEVCDDYIKEELNEDDDDVVPTVIEIIKSETESD